MQKLLERLGACGEAREWVGDRTLEQAWAECESPDWMLWLHARSESADAGAYAALAEQWAEAAARAARAAEASVAAAWAAEAADAAEAAWARAARAAEASVAAAEASVAAAWAAEAADAAEAAVRLQQCEDIRAAMCCPVFEDNK